MKLFIILLYCLCGSLAITVTFGTKDKIIRRSDDNLKDIRLVTINKVPSRPKQTQVRHGIPEEYISVEKYKARQSPTSGQATSKLREDRLRLNLLQNQKQNHHDDAAKIDEAYQTHMQKIANQLYIAQKHADVLSNYQKYILNQDPNVKGYVFGQPQISKRSKPFTRPKTHGRELSIQSTTPESTSEVVIKPATELKRIVVVDPKVRAPKLKRISSKDPSAQSTDVQVSYVTLEPRYVPRYVQSSEIPSKVSLINYQTAQPHYTYYDLGVTQKSQVEPVQISTGVSLGLGAYATPSPNEIESSSLVDQHHHIDTTQLVSSHPQIQASPLVNAYPQVEPAQIVSPLQTYQTSSELHSPHKEIETNIVLGKHPKIRTGHSIELHYPHTDPKYEFMYKVKDDKEHSNFGHMESRTDKTTYGYYYVHLPDGRLETVKYWADKSGYHAKVDYQGEAKHPPAEQHKIHSFNH